MAEQHTKGAVPDLKASASAFWTFIMKFIIWNQNLLPKLKSNISDLEPANQTRRRKTEIPTSENYTKKNTLESTYDM